MIRDIFTLVAVLLILPASIEAQSPVTMRGTVSETVTLSVAPNFQHGFVSGGGNTVRITLSGDDAVIRVPLLVRSNSSFKISAVFDSEVSQLSVVDVHATGTLVSPQAVNGLNLPDKFDSNVVASGPRVSLGGTLNSP